MAHNWSNLPVDILRLISCRAFSITDYLRLAIACKPWWSSLIMNDDDKNNPDFPLPRPPWLITFTPYIVVEELVSISQVIGSVEHEHEDDDDGDLTPVCSFAGLSGTTISRIAIPEFLGTQVLGSSGSWLIAKGDDKRTIFLLNPLTRARIDLPLIPVHELSILGSAMEIPNDFNRVVLSSSSSRIGCSRDFIAAAIYDPWNLAYARIGDKSWTTFESCGGSAMQEFHDIAFHKGRLFAANSSGEVCVYEFTGKSVFDEEDGGVHEKGIVPVAQLFKPPDVALDLELINDDLLNERFYLVEVLKDLLLVIRKMRYHQRSFSYRTERFDVFKIEFNRRKRKWNRKKVKSLGNHSLFLGLNASVSAMVPSGSPSSSSSCTYRENCIYFTEFSDCCSLQYCDMGVFDMKDERIQPIVYPFNSLFFSSAPTWIIPNCTITMGN